MLSSLDLFILEIMLPDDMTILSVGDVLRLTIIDALSVDGVGGRVVCVYSAAVREVRVRIPPVTSCDTGITS